MKKIATRDDSRRYRGPGSNVSRRGGGKKRQLILMKDSQSRGAFRKKHAEETDGETDREKKTEKEREREEIYRRAETEKERGRSLG